MTQNKCSYTIISEGTGTAATVSVIDRVNKATAHGEVRLLFHYDEGGVKRLSGGIVGAVRSAGGKENKYD